ncbi:MAG: hypothetical protein HS104_31915 [Polyangiaceae bacterium]|nr:hypothetical protein [Polyangiaceae bacterium]MCE7888234.1 hypothetical protein [Sorangiineae bacterium PRO1]MCL4749093.1 hypothetical protein [Myxococcales bacterium]
MHDHADVEQRPPLTHRRLAIREADADLAHHLTARQLAVAQRLAQLPDLPGLDVLAGAGRAREHGDLFAIGGTGLGFKSVKPLVWWLLFQGPYLGSTESRISACAWHEDRITPDL